MAGTTEIFGGGAAKGSIFSRLVTGFVMSPERLGNNFGFLPAFFSIFYSPFHRTK